LKTPKAIQSDKRDKLPGTMQAIQGLCRPTSTTLLLGCVLVSTE